MSQNPPLAPCLECGGPRRYRSERKVAGGRGLCQACYFRDYRSPERKYARLAIGPRPRKGPPKWTLDANGCWRMPEWKEGYARMNVGSKWQMSHRVYYERYVGPIPEGYEVDHLCRVRNCVNPQHLEAVTRAENIRRAVVARAANGTRYAPRAA